MSSVAQSENDSATEPSSPESVDPRVSTAPACALSFESLDSLSYPLSGKFMSNSRQSFDSMDSIDSIPRCYSIPNSENSSKFESPPTGPGGRFNTWSKSTWKKRYSLTGRSENNLLDLSSHKFRNAFRRTLKLNKSHQSEKMDGEDKKGRQFHSCDTLDTIGDLMSENKTVTAIVSKGVPDNTTPPTPLSYCTKNYLWYPESLTTSSDSLFIGHKQDFRSICWSQQRRMSGASYVTGSTNELRLSGTAEELRFEETEQVPVTSTRSPRRLSDLGFFKEVSVKVKVPAFILCSKKGHGKEILFTLPPTAKLYNLITEIEKFTNVPLMRYKLCPGLVLQDCLEFWRSGEDMNLTKELQLCTATEEAPTLHFRVISRDTSEMELKVSIALPPMVVTAKYKADSTTADLLSTIINSPKLSETDIKRKMQKFGLYHPKYKVFLRTDELVSFYNIQPSDVLELKTRRQGVCGQSLYLHVDIPDENRAVTVVINNDVTVSDLISKILLEVDSRDESKWNYYGIYLPSSADRQGGWMDDFKVLHSYSLNSVDKVELKTRFRMFIFDLQVYSTSQAYTRHFVNMYISDKITAGEVLRIITSTNCLDYPTSWYGIFLHDNERIPNHKRLCEALENKGISKQDSLVVHMIHQPIHVSLGGDETTKHTFMVDFSMPLQQLHAIFCRYYGIRVAAACLLEHENKTLDLKMCAIKNKLSLESSVTISCKRLLSPGSAVPERSLNGMVRQIRLPGRPCSLEINAFTSVKVSDTSEGEKASASADINSDKSPPALSSPAVSPGSSLSGGSPSPSSKSPLSSLSPPSTARSPHLTARSPSPSVSPLPTCRSAPPTAPRPSLSPLIMPSSVSPLVSPALSPTLLSPPLSPVGVSTPDMIDLIFSETISKGEVTFYEPTNGSTPHFPQVNGITPGVQLNGVHSDEEVEVSQLSLREQIQKSAIKSVSPTSPTSFTKRLEPSTPPGPEKVVLRKPIERVKRAQSKIYEEDDINIWDDDSLLEKTLIFELDGKIKSGTFNRFIELLTDNTRFMKLMTDSSKNRIDFVKVFLLTYQAFTTPKQLLRKLIQRYHVPRDHVPGDLQMTMEEFTKYRTCIQKGVINCLKLWVADGHDFENNTQLQREFMDFIHTCVLHDNPQHYRVLRQKFLVVRGMVQLPPGNKEVVLTPPLKLPANLSPNSTLFDHGAEEIARQLTLLDFILFTKIKPIELVNQAWVKPKYSHQAKNILHFADRMNTITRWAATSILAQKDKGRRAKLITDFIIIADELYKLNNFSSFMAIINALEGSAISRLYGSWNKVEQKYCRKSRELYEIILPDNNFRELRKKVAQADPPCIPFVPTFMSDLTVVSECNPTVVDGMINFHKCSCIYDIIDRLRLYQQKKYLFEVVPSIATPLQQLHALDEETLYEMSHQMEPKKSNR